MAVDSMQAGFAIWQDRISAVFDVTRQVHVVRVDGGRIVDEQRACLAGDLPLQKAQALAALAVDELVCGAISRPLHHAVEGYGIRVIPFVAGELGAVVAAWLTGPSGLAPFIMPGWQGDDARFE